MPSDSPHRSADLFWHRLRESPEPTRTASRIVAEYDYTDEHGVLLFQAVRFEPKRFAQRRPDGAGGWVWKLGDVRVVPYRLPELIAAAAADDPIFVVEGEADADRIRALGLAATCNPMGAGKWRDEFSTFLRGATDVRVVADRDAAGYRHATAVAASLRSVGASVRVFEAASGKDATDHLDAGFSVADLVEIDAEERLRALAGPASEAGQFGVGGVGEGEATRYDAAPQEGSPNSVAGRPVVSLSERQLDALLDDATRALVAANDPPTLFMRSGFVVTVRRDEERRPIVANATETALVEYLSRAARWVRGARDKTRDAGPTRELAGVLLERLTRTPTLLPPLRGVTESPLMRADGSLLVAPGYDRETRLYYAPTVPVDVPPVPEAPSEDERARARGLLDELFTDFPLVGDADYAGVLSALLTLTLREMFTGCVPLHLFDAPAPGTGKGLAADVVAMIGTGNCAAKMPEPDGRGDDEWRKRITALLVEGRSVAVIDNVERPLGSAALASVITTESWSDRVLGATRMVTVPNRMVVVATGNNIRLRGDLPRRCAWVRMDARDPRPWTRAGFRHPDLLAWTAERRGEILGAVFTLARAWIAAGRPGPGDAVPRLGSFEAWRSAVGGVLRVAELPGFLGNLEQLHATADEDTPAWAGFLAAWREAFGTESITVAVLIERIEKTRGGPLADALPAEIAIALEKPASAAKKIGWALARKADTRFVLDDGITARLVRGEDSHKKVARWRVREG